jgi:hypothetical protein
MLIPKPSKTGTDLGADIVVSGLRDSGGQGITPDPFDAVGLNSDRSPSPWGHTTPGGPGPMIRHDAVVE